MTQSDGPDLIFSSSADEATRPLGAAETCDEAHSTHRPTSIAGLANPRLSDVFGLTIRQDDVDFAIPHLREDLRFSLDPFLLWKSNNPDYIELHAALLDFIEQVRFNSIEGNDIRAQILLAEVAEPVELGLGYAQGSKKGSALGPALRGAIIAAFRDVPQLAQTSLNHMEILALLVPKIAEDRISDITASVAKKWLAHFSEERAREFEVPVRRFRMIGWDTENKDWRPFEAHLPYNPLDDSAVLLAPLDLLRHLPWINYENYYRTTYSPLILPPSRQKKAVPKEAVLAYNRTNYELIQGYVDTREQQSAECSPDPLFTPLQVDTLKRKLSALRGLSTGRKDGADKKFEDLAFDLLSSLLYPELDLADSRIRTISGAHIRDVIFHNDRKTPFMGDIRDQYGARQIVFELKNVASLETEHVNQLYRYLDDSDIGHFGILVARTPPPRNVRQNIVDLHSSKRAVVLCIDDSDLELMFELLLAGRRPIEALRKKYIEFTRTLPK